MYFICNFIIHSFLSGSLQPTNDNVCGPIAQLVRASHRYRKVTDSKSVEVLNTSTRNYKNCAHNCEDHSLFQVSVVQSDNDFSIG